MGFFGSRSRQAKEVTYAVPTTTAPAAETAQHDCLPPRDASRLVHKPSSDSSIGVTMQSKPGGVTTISCVKPGSTADEAGLVAGDLVRFINGDAVDSANVGCVLLQSAPAGFIEIIVTTTAPEPTRPSKDAPNISPWDHELELLPVKSMLPTFDRQVRELSEMGFTDAIAAQTALRATNGDVPAAIERLVASQ